MGMGMGSWLSPDTSGSGGREGDGDGDGDMTGEPRADDGRVFMGARDAAIVGGKFGDEESPGGR